MISTINALLLETLVYEVVFYNYFYPPSQGKRQEWFRNHSCTTCSPAAPWESHTNVTRRITYNLFKIDATTPSTTQNNLAIIHSGSGRSRLELNVLLYRNFKDYFYSRPRYAGINFAQ
jgi:hypothetical protein